MNIDFSVITKLPLSIAVLDQNNFFVNCSDEWTEQFNKKRNDLIGSSFFDAFPWHKSELAIVLNAKIKREALISGNEQVVKNKKNLWFDWKVRSVLSDKKNINM